MDVKLLRDMDDASFYQFMKAEGRKIDPNISVIVKLSTNILDPYSRSNTEEHCICSKYFVASPGTLWVYASDVPDEIWKKIMENKGLRADRIDEMFLSQAPC